MDRLTHISVTNGVKELDALKFLILSEQFSFAQIADWVVEISWNLENVFQRIRYNSDEFQCLLKELIQNTKREEKRRLHANPEKDNVGC